MKQSLCALLALLALSSVLSAADNGFTGGLLVVVGRGAWPHDDREMRSDIVLDLEADNGRWRRVYGYGLNIGDHFGFVQEASIEQDRVRIKLPVIIAPDDWIPGGDAYYEIDLKRDASGRLVGRWKGTFRNEPIEGEAYAQFKPQRPIRVPNFRPLEPQEHPRMLMRRHEVPALREKLKTPLGQAYLAKAQAAAAAGDPVSNGMLHQLTGEAKYAEAARKIIGAYNDLAPEGTGTGSVGHRFVAVSLAADLCWDAWPGGFRKELMDRMLNDLSVIQRRLQIAGANFHPCSNYYGPARGMCAIATLLFYGEKGPEPKRPVPPDDIVASGDLAAKLMAKSGQLEKYRLQYPSLLAKWQTQHAEWKAGGEADLDVTEYFHKAFWHMNRHYRVGIGDGGFAAETGAYSAIAPRYPLFYAAYYLRCFGRNASAFPDATHHMSRRLMQCVFPPPGGTGPRRAFRENEPIALKVNSIAGFTYGGLEWLAATFPMSPDEHKPALLWAWNYIRNVDPADPASITNIIPEAGEYGVYLAHAFINYPLDMKPQHPKEVMPLTWAASGTGLYLFRSGWNGTDDSVAQVFLKSQRIGGWNHPNAGTFALWSLGHAWATCNPERVGFREQENVVLLPDDSINGGNCGYASVYEPRKDGSGSLTIDMRDLYGATKATKASRKKGPTIQPGGITIKHSDEGERGLPFRDSLNNRLPENWADSGISGVRAFGLDFSGRSGAPCLMVVADRITGGGRKVWTWHIDRDTKQKSEPADVRIDGNTFTIRRGDAFLKATIVSPAGVKIARNRVEAALSASKTGKGHRFEGFLDRIEATADRAGDFLVVITVQRKDAPEVKAEGAGADARVTVGAQKIGFDGNVVRIE